ncbi:CinA family nicotinamide mononucleotide deamidase-related protein [Photobacterium japonica]|uniref:CinA family nicotinamide mononucleotide deamidase-related protein n=1 Tax=Photobacterium japonica TaxID=2910235 RepID=UPI003D0A6707
MLEVVMISTGEEVLHGDIVDTNAAWLSWLFFEQGFAMTRRTTVGDQREQLAKEIEHCSLTADIVVVNGGLGPTTDDLTAQAAAIAADVGLELSDHWVAQMQEKYTRVGREMPATNIKQAMLPAGAELIDNPIGTACGFAMRLNRAWIFFTPGVPREFKQMVHEQILPRLSASFAANQTDRDCLRLYTFGLSESGISEMLDPLVLPEGFELGYRSYLPFIEVKVFVPLGHSEADGLYQQIAALLGENVVGQGQPLLDALKLAMAASSQTLAVVEGYTGGAVINALHDAEFGDLVCQGTVVNKSAVVSPISVSPSSAHNDAEAMACDALNNSDASLALAVSHCDDQQITLALASANGVWSQTVSTRRQYAYRDHRMVIATVALDMLRRVVDGKPVFGHYESLITHASRYLPIT